MAVMVLCHDLICLCTQCVREAQILKVEILLAEFSFMPADTAQSIVNTEMQK